jgi:hypothetical protein
MKKNERPASDVLEGVVKNNHNDFISFMEIKMALHERSFGLLMLFFALPVCIPALPPGMASIPAIPLLVFSIQMLRGMDSPWMPGWLGKKTLKRETLAFIVQKTTPYLKKVEKLLTPRFSFASSAKGEKIIGLFALFFSISILIPLPLSNFLPALGILVMSLGLLSKDGVIIIMGMILGSLGVLLTSMVIFFGQQAVISFLK